MKTSKLTKSFVAVIAVVGMALPVLSRAQEVNPLKEAYAVPKKEYSPLDNKMKIQSKLLTIGLHVGLPMTPCDSR